MTTQSETTRPKLFTGCATEPPFHAYVMIEPLTLTDEDIRVMTPRIEAALIECAQWARQEASRQEAAKKGASDTIKEAQQ